VPAPVATAQGGSASASPLPQGAAASPAPISDLNSLWEALLERVQQERALIITWLRVATPQSFDNGLLKVGFPKSENEALNSLRRDSQLQFLQRVTSTLAGLPVRLDLRIDPSLPEPLASEMGIDLFGAPAADPLPPVPPAAALAVQASPAPAPKAEAAPAGSLESAPQAAGGGPEPQDDPLIRQAVEKFRLKLLERESGKPAA
jgi:DNA polymerase-3 subunit gamma/tau